MDQNPVLFPPVTNRESWSPIFVLTDDDTDELIDLTDITFQLEIRRLGGNPANYGSGYGENYDIGQYSDAGSPIITATLDDGITVLDTGTFQLFLTSDQMRTLCADVYSVACVISDGTNDRQLFLGRLPVLNGMVT